MSGTQRVLVFHLIVTALTASLYTALLLVVDPYAANAAWACMALMALEKRVRRDEPIDERDQAILARASLIAYSLFWVCLVLGCTAVSVWRSPDSIPAWWLSVIPMAGFCMLYLIRSTTGLALYGRDS